MAGFLTKSPNLSHGLGLSRAQIEFELAHGCKLSLDPGDPLEYPGKSSAIKNPVKTCPNPCKAPRRPHLTLVGIVPYPPIAWIFILIETHLQLQFANLNPRIRLAAGAPVITFPCCFSPFFPDSYFTDKVLLICPHGRQSSDLAQCPVRPKDDFSTAGSRIRLVVGRKWRTKARLYLKSTTKLRLHVVWYSNGSVFRRGYPFGVVLKDNQKERHPFFCATGSPKK